LRIHQSTFCQEEGCKVEYRFLEPIDVLYLRGNKLFGEAGAHGEALMPPWPSLAAGSLRSRMLVAAGCDPAEFGRCRIEPKEPLKSALGTPKAPGTFRVSLFALGRRNKDVIEPCLPPPADLVIRRNESGLSAIFLKPSPPRPGILCGSPVQQFPVLRTDAPFKPESDLWLSAEGLRRYLEGDPISSKDLLPREKLWKLDTRLGIALAAATRTAESGRIYTAETIALSPDAGFLVGVSGADGLVPRNGMLRFGGDGRGVQITCCPPSLPEAPWDRIARERRFRLVLTTPAFFGQGWLPPGCREEGGGWFWKCHGVCARLVAAAVKRHEVVSGWDLALHRPKDALRAVPAGSVYWFESLEGGLEGLRSTIESGLWDAENPARIPRQAEGFNGVMVAAWPRD